MEPNQNTAGVPGASAAGQNMAATPAQNVTAAPVQGATSEPLPKGNMMAAPANEKKKGGSGMVIGLILCLLLAVGGIGFGVWMMMDGNTQKDALNQQISALKKQNNELQEKISDLDVSSDVDSADYIYVGEWGLKFKIPEGLEKISYLVDYRVSEQYENYLYINGVAGNYEGTPSFLNTSVEEYWLGCLHRLVQGEEPELKASMGTLVTTIDGFEYYYGGPQASKSKDGQDLDLESETVNLIRQMLTNPENYSKI